jgi:hypothetical protein
MIHVDSRSTPDGAMLVVIQDDVSSQRVVVDERAGTVLQACQQHLDTLLAHQRMLQGKIALLKRTIEGLNR